MSRELKQFDLFVSYSRTDNANRWISRFIEEFLMRQALVRELGSNRFKPEQFFTRLVMNVKLYQAKPPLARAWQSVVARHPMTCVSKSIFLSSTVGECLQIAPCPLVNFVS